MLVVSVEKKSRSGDECRKHMVRITFRRSGLPLSRSKSQRLIYLWEKSSKKLEREQGGLQVSVTSLDWIHSVLLWVGVGARAHVFKPH